MSKYDRQANDFMVQTQCKMECHLLGTFPYFHDDEEPRDVWQVTLETPKGAYSFRFGNSLRATKEREWLANPRLRFLEDCDLARRLGVLLSTGVNRSKAAKARDEANKGPSAYDVLSSLIGRHPGTFEDFCSDCGYDTDSRKGFESYQAVLKEHSGVSRIFSSEELDKLEEIA